MEAAWTKADFITTHLQEIAEHVAVVLDKDMSKQVLANRLNGALRDLALGKYDEHIRRAYCAARTNFTYRSVFSNYMMPAIADAHTVRAAMELLSTPVTTARYM